MKLHVNATEPLYISSIKYIYVYVTVLSIIRYIYIIIYSYSCVSSQMYCND